MMIQSSTAICALFGDPVEHSLSPLMHNAAFASLGLDLAYLAFRVGEIGPAVMAMKALDVRGASVTIPHKEAAVAFVDGLDDDAARIGSINTIYRRDGMLIGANTEGAAAMDVLTGAGALEGRPDVVVLGAGGAARAVVFGLARSSAISALTVLSRGPGRCERLCREVTESARFEVVPGRLAEGSSPEVLGRCGLLINCTPLGMAPGPSESPVPGEWLHKGMTVFDMIYNPVRTELLRLAAERGAATVEGVEMFVRQGAMQFSLWTGRPAPVDLMRETVREALEARP